MELRVWVDGTQRIVCGVKLTTTCQQIVFALAHATQQAGRFTMVERWRNEERLLSPNEQPLVTLQRWGDHMNEVEFILRKNNDTTHNGSPNLANLTRQRYSEEHPVSATNPLPPPPPAPTGPAPPVINNQQQLSHMRLPQNGYQQHQQRNDFQIQNNQQAPLPDLSLPQQTQQLNNHNHNHTHPNTSYPCEDLYSTVNKKKPNQNLPPAIPAKPRLVPSGSNVSLAMNSMHQISKSNYYPLPQTMCVQDHQGVRPKCPPAYLEYMEAMANRNNYSHPINTGYSPQNHMSAATTLQPSFNNTYGLARSQSSINMPMTNTNYNRLSTNGTSIQPRHLLYDRYDITSPPNIGYSNGSMGPRLSDPGLCLNQAPATSARPSPGNYNSSSFNNSTHQEFVSNNHEISNNSVAKMGHDMLKVIEEQKKLLINQKNELEMLDSDMEFCDSKDSKQNELINKIEEEIHHLEGLRKENEAQIKKLENQDFEKQLQNLKEEQNEIETEIDKQKDKLSKFEDDIASCMKKIEQLEAELATIQELYNL